MSNCCVDGAATQFPQGTGVAATWNPELVFQMGVVTSDESRGMMHFPNRSVDYRTGASSVINILKDGRWGRAPETYGECPILTGTIAVALNKALVGFKSLNSTTREYGWRLKTLPVLRHFVAYAGPDSERFSFSATVSDDDLSLTYLHAWKAVADAGALGGVMSAISGLNGVPSAADRRMLTDVLRGEWEWDGFVTSDCDTISAIGDDFHWTSNLPESCAEAVRAGGDLNCGPEYKHLINASKYGLIGQAEIDLAVTRLLGRRIQVGDLDPPGADPYGNIPLGIVDSPPHRALARQLVRESLVLLTNPKTSVGDKNVLPLRSSGIIAVIGPSADDIAVQAHTYHGTPSAWITVLDGIKQVAPAATILTAPGCSRKGSSTAGFAEAVRLASQADQVIWVGGLEASMEEEGTDRTDDIGLPGVQLALIKELQRVGKPMAAVVISGGPVSEPTMARMPGLAWAWISYFGQDGRGIADVLFGDTNPSGRLPFTIPSNLSQLGDIHDYSLTAAPYGKTYRYLAYSQPAAVPLFAFGAGLSYSSFETTIATNTTTAAPTDTVEVMAAIRNQGPLPGQHVVALFCQFLQSDGVSPGSVKQLPRRELVALSKIHLSVSEARNISWQLRIRDIQGALRQAFPGVIRFWIGDGGPCTDCPTTSVQLAW
eukprot:TRINITY_DN21452_c0_g1_i6.p1 TRINITY_DN21452_c0_g1~~TRINITY_DN21452_c0_g1_i6.p1  ORF type:complete len:658 (+),score=101.37 TRINITY_DN21452_c0_g1_i6:164-2137(+)